MCFWAETLVEICCLQLADCWQPEQGKALWLLFLALTHIPQSFEACLHINLWKSHTWCSSSSFLMSQQALLLLSIYTHTHTHGHAGHCTCQTSNQFPLSKWLVCYAFWGHYFLPLLMLCISMMKNRLQKVNVGLCKALSTTKENGKTVRHDNSTQTDRVVSM